MKSAEMKLRGLAAACDKSKIVPQDLTHKIIITTRFNLALKIYARILKIRCFKL